MKDISKLSVKEIEEKIEIFTDRYKTLKGIIRDIKEPSAKDALGIQQTNYKLMVNRLKKELVKRKRS